jgi:hypothetical protein
MIPQAPILTLFKVTMCLLEVDNISLWIRSQATIWVVFEADYEIKLLVITNGKKGDNMDILKLQKSFIWVHTWDFIGRKVNQRNP